MKLTAENLKVSRSGTEVLKGVSFSVKAGDIYALLGGNGAGKSTTLLTFMGFLPTDSGTVWVNGLDVAAHSAATRKTMSYLPEAASLYEHLNAEENLSYFLKLAGTDFTLVEINAALDRVSLDRGARKRRLKGYSKGMRQKVAIALSILRDTDILLLDEPTSGLDPIAIDEFNALVRALADAGKAILMVTHDVYGACQVADRIGLLRAGKLVGEFQAKEGQPIETDAVHRAFAGESLQ